MTKARRPYLNIQHFAEPIDTPTDVPTPTPNPNDVPTPIDTPKPSGLTEEQVQRMIADAVATAVANIKIPEPTPTPEPTPKPKAKSYTDDPEYKAIMEDLKYKQRMELESKKSELKSVYGLEDSDLEGLNSLSELSNLEKITKKAQDKAIANTLTEEKIVEFINGKTSIVESMKTAIDAKNIVKKQKDEEVKGSILGFFKKK